MALRVRTSQRDDAGQKHRERLAVHNEVERLLKFMKLQIAWRNPIPLLRTAGRLEAVVQNDTGSLYVLRREEAKELTFELIKGGISPPDSLAG